MMSQDEGRSYDWNEEIENDGEDITLLPKADYPFEVIGFERGRHDGGGEKLPPCNMAKLTLKLDGGSLGTGIANDRLYLHSSMERKLCSFFRAIGARKHGERIRMDWSRVMGAKGRCTIGQHTYNGKTYNEVIRYLDPDPKPTQAPPFTPGQQPSPPPQPTGYTPGKF